MEPLQSLAHKFGPTARHGLAFSAMPDAPVLPLVERTVRFRRAKSSVRQVVMRLRTPSRRTEPARITCVR